MKPKEVIVPIPYHTVHSSNPIYHAGAVEQLTWNRPHADVILCNRRHQSMGEEVILSKKK